MVEKDIKTTHSTVLIKLRKHMCNTVKSWHQDIIVCVNIPFLFQIPIWECYIKGSNTNRLCYFCWYTWKEFTVLSLNPLCAYCFPDQKYTQTTKNTFKQPSYVGYSVLYVLYNQQYNNLPIWTVWFQIYTWLGMQ